MISNNNSLAYKKRLKELFFDYLFIMVYLIILLITSMFFYVFFLKGIPRMNELQSHLIVLFTSVFPLYLIFSFMDYSRDGSFGKKRSGLILIYKDKSIKNSLIRNGVKFLPWQIGHMATVHGIYTNYDSLAILLSIISIVFAMFLFLMAFLRKDKRHLGDLLAGTQVQVYDK